MELTVKAITAIPATSAFIFDTIFFIRCIQLNEIIILAYGNKNLVMIKKHYILFTKLRSATALALCYIMMLQ